MASRHQSKPINLHTNINKFFISSFCYIHRVLKTSLYGWVPPKPTQYRLQLQTQTHRNDEHIIEKGITSSHVRGSGRINYAAFHWRNYMKTFYDEMWWDQSQHVGDQQSWSTNTDTRKGIEFVKPTRHICIIDSHLEWFHLYRSKPLITQSSMYSFIVRFETGSQTDTRTNSLQQSTDYTFVCLYIEITTNTNLRNEIFRLYATITLTKYKQIILFLKHYKYCLPACQFNVQQ